MRNARNAWRCGSGTLAACRPAPSKSTSACCTPPPEDSAARWRTSTPRARCSPRPGKARWYRVDMLRRAGRSEEASALARQALAELPHVRPWDMYLPEAWWIAHRAFGANGETQAAEAVLVDARRWIAEAMRDVPQPFVDGFRQRNAVNQALLARPLTLA